MTGLLLHALHVALLVLGTAGAAYLLLPQLRGRAVAHGSGYRPPRTVTEHHQRVAHLRVAVATGTILDLERPPRAEVGGSAPAGVTMADLRTISACGTLSAAVVHAAVFPHHLLERPLVGLFFAVTALGQAAWALQVMRSAGDHLLRVGIVANGLLIGLWAVSRAVGLPAGLDGGHESVGAWDLAAVGWELTAVLTLALLLHRPSAHRTGPVTVVGRRSWLFAGLSTVGLVLITALLPHG